jgi:hypothetical protein
MWQLSVLLDDEEEGPQVVVQGRIKPSQQARVLSEAKGAARGTIQASIPLKASMPTRASSFLAKGVSIVRYLKVATERLHG